MNHPFSLILIESFLVLSAGAARAQSSLGTGFHFQGQLKVGEQPANGQFAMDFTLFDAKAQGMQIGATISLDVTVENGLFGVLLNDSDQFGPEAFNGTRRFLEITVDDILLTPRQEITATPYAHAAETALSVDGVDGHSLDSSDGSAVDVVFVDGHGNVGVGTDSPSPTYRFHVVGNSRVDGDLYFGSADLFEVAHENNIGMLIDPVNLKLHLEADNNVGLTLTDTGNVGIGTTSPTARLEVNGTARMTGFHLPTGAAAGRHLVSNAAGVGTWLPLSISTSEILDSAVTHAKLADDPASLARVSGGDITNNAGNIGIGTTSPGAPLHVREGAAGTISPQGNASLVLERNANNYANILAPDANETGILFGKPTGGNAAGGIVFNHSATPNGLQLRTNGNLTRMTIMDNGNVGIGTTAPALKLDVNGAAVVRDFFAVTAPVPNDGAVQLPGDSISSLETRDEPGVASDFRNPIIELVDNQVVIASRTITVPAAGFVVAYVSAYMATGVTAGNAQPLLKIYKNSDPSNASNWGAELGSFDSTTLTFHAIFEVSQGPNGFTVEGRSISNTVTLYNRRMTLLFFPTAYGTVDLENF